MPELLRVKGELLLLQGGSEAAAAAEDLFGRRSTGHVSHEVSSRAEHRAVGPGPVDT